VTTTDQDDAREALEAERSFLLRSLDDLDGERAAGNIDDATYSRLHADYTARAAAVLRRLRDGDDVHEPVAPAPKVSARRRWLTYGAIGVFAVTAALLLAQSVHQRTPGGSVTGNDPNAANATNLGTLKKNADENPGNYNAHLLYARALLGNDLSDAVKQYDDAARIDPNQPEPLVYGAWIRALAAAQVTNAATRQTLVNDAMARFKRAIQLNPRYPDSYVFRALTYERVLNDPTKAIPDFESYLKYSPANASMRPVVTGALSQAESAAAGTTPTSKQP
jgi:cytochrome c-type biogenesis protein CcmH/NrfG